MADSDTPKAAKKKIAGLSVITWGAILAGAAAVVIVYKKVAGNSAATAATGTTDGQTEPTADDSETGTVASLPTTLGGWVTAFLSGNTNATYTPSLASNDVTNWLNGNCVSAAGYKAIGNALETLGLPAGYDTAPTLSVCAPPNDNPPPPATGGGTVNTTPTTPTTPPPLSAALQAQLNGNGETVTQTLYDAASKSWLYFTDIGGVYAPNGGFQGSIPGLAPGQRLDTNKVKNATVNSLGGYIITLTDGATYAFGPQPSTKTPAATGTGTGAKSSQP